MPSVIPPQNERLAAMLAGMANQGRIGATQQQASYADGQGNVILLIGLMPGTDPAQYGLLARSTSAVPVMYVGSAYIPDGSGRQQTIFELNRDDGSTALVLGDEGTTPGHPHQQALQWYDRSGNNVFSDDTVGGVGLARPHLATGQLANTNVSTWPATTAGTWTTIAAGYVEVQQPRLSWVFQIFAPTSVTGQFRLRVNGTQVGTTQTVANNTFSTWGDTQSLPAGSAFGSLASVTLEAQVTAGAGTIAAAQYFLSGVGS